MQQQEGLTKCLVEMKDYAQSQCFNGLSLRFTLYHSAHRESSLLMKLGIGQAPQVEGGGRFGTLGRQGVIDCGYVTKRVEHF